MKKTIFVLFFVLVTSIAVFGQRHRDRGYERYDDDGYYGGGCCGGRGYNYSVVEE